jgi:hypothetical protein
MSMTEVAYEIKDLADYMVSSEISMPALSVLGANVWLKELINTPAMSSFDLSKRIVQCVYDNGSFAQKTTHMAVTDLSKMDLLGSKIANLGNKLTTEVGQNWTEVFDSWKETHYINEGFPSFTDLREFVKKLQQKPGLSQINLIKQACDDVLSAFNEAVPFTKSYLKDIDQPYGGLTIHFPQQAEQFNQADYNNLKFKDVNWHNFLSIFIENTQGQGLGDDEIVLSGKVSYPGHTLSANTYVLIYTVVEGNTTLLGYGTTEPDGTYEFLVTDITQTTDLAFEAFDDANNNEDLDYGEGYAFWDGNGNNTWDDILTVEPKTTYTGIDFILIPSSGSAGVVDPVHPIKVRDLHFLNK